MTSSKHLYNRRHAIRAAAAIALTISAAWVSPALAHELESDRLTLIQRQDRLIEATWLVDLPAVLHRSLSPQEPYAEFLTRLAASGQPEVERLLAQARAQWERDMVLKAPHPIQGRWQRWQWPDAKALQAAAQERLMQRVSGAHEHPKPLSVQAQWLADSGGRLEPLSLSVPPALRPLMVVSYRPRQLMMGRSSSTIQVRF